MASDLLDPVPNTTSHVKSTPKCHQRQGEHCVHTVLRCVLRSHALTRDAIYLCPLSVCDVLCFTDDEDDFGSRSGRIKHFVLLYELRRLRQVRVALDGELADGREAIVASVGEVGTVGQHCSTQTHRHTHKMCQ